MNCIRCGTLNNDSASFCKKCGSPIRLTTAAALRFCTACGAPAGSAMAYCANCGKPLAGLPTSAPIPMRSPNPVVAPAYYTGAPRVAAVKKRPRNKRFAVIAVGIPVLALLIVLAVVLLPKLLVSKTSTEIGTDGGQVVLDNFEMTFEEDAVDSPVTVTVTDVTSQQTMAGLQSQLYMVEADGPCDQPVTVRLTLPASIGTDNLMLGVGTEITSSDGTTTTMSYRYVEGTIVDGALEATIVPSEYSGGIGFFSRADAPYIVPVAAGKPMSNPKPQNIKVVCGIAATEYFYEDGGHFRILYPTSQNDSVDKRANAYKLLDDLEDAYNAFLEAGFSYTLRWTWPVDVSIVPMDVEGAYIENNLANQATERSAEHGWVELNSKNFTSGYNREMLKGIIGHEWFHFVQANYCTSGITSAWLADATATWYEGSVTKGIPSIIMQYFDKLFDGVIPAADTAADGYARAPVIKYLVEKYGVKCLLQTYQSIDRGTDPRAALIGAVGEPTVWVGDCYEYIVSGKTQDADPYKFYQNICNKDPAAKPFSSLVNLTTPTADELKKAAADQTPITIGQLQVTAPATGARLIAFTVDNGLAKALLDGMSLVIKVEGPPVDYRLFTIDGKQFSVSKPGPGGIVISDLKAALNGDTKFLLLVTSTSEGDKKVFRLTASLQAVTSPTLDEIVGTYDDGAATLQDVHVDQAVYDTLDGIIAQGDSGGDSYKQNIAGLQARIGEVMPMSFDIRKTGDTSGEIVGGGVSLPFTYVSGVITINKELKNDDGKTYEYDQGTLNATYDKNKGIVIAGSFTQTVDGIYTSSQYYFPHGSFYLVKQLTGTKPAN